MKNFNLMSALAGVNIEHYERRVRIQNLEGLLDLKGYEVEFGMRSFGYVRYNSLYGLVDLKSKYSMPGVLRARPTACMQWMETFLVQGGFH